jgi:hypothetical protein
LETHNILSYAQAQPCQSNLEGGCHQEEAPLDPREQGEGGHHGCQAVQGRPDQPGQLEPEEVQEVIVFPLFVFRFG